ncbi:hypothetical protein [Kineococcus rhizosphaerae]|uniref:Lipoprotein n=1 Tax=Kineococcus rhizosphaerae TaxID=559628 RepID=A0A2T0R9F0_9ACTN|nr:hypothetical protein [Kineococcus rhizosphaerae]PRY17796.1 hypothetical protein CLV37_10131 [Kineococcus rhizosphaerae]
MSRTRVLVPALVLAVALTACSRTSDVAPPVAAAPTTPSVGPTAATAEFDGDAAVGAFRAYLREQALAVNAGTADPAQLPGFTATLTAAGQQWALALLADNLGDRMPGPYPSGVLGSTRPSADRVDLSLCLQDRGWQVNRTTGRPVNAAHFATASAVVVRVGERWLVDDVVSDGGQCSASDVTVERF